MAKSNHPPTIEAVCSSHFADGRDAVIFELKLLRVEPFPNSCYAFEFVDRRGNRVYYLSHVATDGKIEIKDLPQMPSRDECNLYAASFNSKLSVTPVAEKT